MDISRFACIKLIHALLSIWGKLLHGNLMSWCLDLLLRKTSRNVRWYKNPPASSCKCSCDVSHTCRSYLNITNPISSTGLVAILAHLNVIRRIRGESWLSGAHCRLHDSGINFLRALALAYLQHFGHLQITWRTSKIVLFWPVQTKIHRNLHRTQKKRKLRRTSQKKEKLRPAFKSYWMQWSFPSA